MYAGFLELQQEEWPESVVKAAAKREAVCVGVWKKPPWAVGASEPIVSAAAAAAAAAPAAAAAAAAGGGGAGLIDEDSLINPQDSNYTPLGKGRSDCASRPRACANCTCGRKELEEKAEKEAFKKQLETGAVRSSCGNCYLGDAFRCAGCPYRGLPAFRPGEKVDLSSEGRAATAAAVASVAAAAAETAGGAAAAGITVAEGTKKVMLSSLDDDL
ncbi:Anamorsin homolog, related [Eimeria praecox]|uniref:Anamorsin homolog, related n=1 Tax=Eimeria praecox TaxID=51316 RepID=U6H5W1_9EIME|nr:Anamorsin homolog, related [Eimeria praecox]